ncbi:hypothetical protein Tco_0248217, partial [Tanacetum coccineum]
ANAAIVSAVCQANDHGFGGIRIPKQKRNTGTKEMKVFLFRDVIFIKKVMKALEMNEEGLRWIEFYELMIDLQSICDPESNVLKVSRSVKAQRGSMSLQARRIPKRGIHKYESH